MPTRDIPLSRNSQMVSILCIHGQRAGTFSPNCSLVKLPISHSPCAKFLLQIGDTPPAGQFEVLTPYCIATPTSPSFQWTFYRLLRYFCLVIPFSDTYTSFFFLQHLSKYHGEFSLPLLFFPYSLP